MNRNPYEVLEIPVNSDQETIRTAYKRLALKYHPDRNKENKELNEERFKEVSLAYEKLTNVSFQKGNIKIEELFMDLFSNLFKKPEEKNELSIYKEISLSLADVYNGKKVSINYQRQIPKNSSICSSCNGTGSVYSIEKDMPASSALYQMLRPCHLCAGKGLIGELIVESCSVDIKIPPGFSEKTLFFEKKGNVDLSHQEGDLFIHVNYKKDPVFVKDGNDLKTTINISFKDSILGVDYNLHTLDDETLQIPIGYPIRHGKILKLKGFGMPTPTGFGDLYVKVSVDVPNKDEYEVIKKALS